MPRNATIDLDLAVILAEACKQTYSQFERKGDFDPPQGFRSVCGFKATSLLQPEWFGYVARSEREAIVAFRGTVTDRDWVADAEFFQVDYPYAAGEGTHLRTHDGFTKLYSSCRDEVIHTLTDLPDTLTLYITGHSLGGGLAALCTMDACQCTSFKDIIMYTFAGPRAGNPAFARAFNKEVHTAVRVVNVHDIVPRLPPGYIHMPETSIGLRYQHVGREFSFSAQTGSVIGNHEIATYIHELKRLQESPPGTSHALRLRTYEHPRGRTHRARRVRIRGITLDGSPAASKRRPG